MDFKFNWEFSETDLETLVNVYKDRFFADDYLGNCRIGDTCFDFVLRHYSEDNGDWSLDYDLYVGGRDTGYGYGENNYPYDYLDGGSWPLEKIENMTYTEFVNMAEKDMQEFIVKSKCVDEASKPLNIW